MHTQVERDHLEEIIMNGALVNRGLLRQMEEDGVSCKPVDVGISSWRYPGLGLQEATWVSIDLN